MPGSQRKGLCSVWGMWHLRPSLDNPGGDFQEAVEMSVQKINTQFKRQVVHLGSENCNSEYTELGRNTDSGLIIVEGIREFYREKKEEDEVSCFEENFVGADKQS